MHFPEYLFIKIIKNAVRENAIRQTDCQHKLEILNIDIRC